MIVLRQTQYANIAKYIPHASLALSATGVALSASRNKQLKEQNQAQLQAMKDLTRSLGKVDSTMKSVAERPVEDNIKRKSQPKQKFSLQW